MLTMMHSQVNCLRCGSVSLSINFHILLVDFLKMQNLEIQSYIYCVETSNILPVV